MDIIIQSATYSSTQGIQKKARPTLPWVKGSRLAVQNSFPSGLVYQTNLSKMALCDTAQDTGPAGASVVRKEFPCFVSAPPGIPSS